MRLIHILGLAGALAAGVASAHEGHDHNAGKGTKPPPAAVLQLDDVRNATARYLDVQKATDDGYVDIGLFVANMGWHYQKMSRVDARFDMTRPEFLVYADDPCGGPRKLVAVEYAVPFEFSRRAPEGFIGKADQWDANQTYRLWTLHAWVFEYNPDGVFAAFNPRVP
ncbi:MAG TPA: hypothetical protein VFP37_04835 [Steroidobacteraceae bacterium]|nr:hypothetical protein [Steroidobacteraceae bacterium]